ncbi:hypothetical protein [Pseudoalteromonas sp. S16_S37]|uniref:hypothetical protein n=1 Tax=Pseudoalteromonas sp. S16_S37 TaxID=2720228 RepID=UPI001680A2B0|nr:hypothetical protein [Pseudoalteromonas sp. S16_S37]MBD1583461.1 hypothetical protein [Pseudoalteromonas sp. S16_S37]
MQEQNTQLIQQVFNPEITAQGLAGLRKKYPSNVVYDMSNDEQYKLGTAARTERNKLKAGFKRARIDFNNELVEKEKSLAEEVDKIYAPIIEPMEREEKRRKEEAARIKREKEERLAKERNGINQIRNFISDCQNKDAQYIADTIESVDLIDTSVFSKDLIHEAIEAKEQTLATLMLMLSDAKAREKLAAEQAVMDAQKRLNQLQMYTLDCIGKSAGEIERKLEVLRELPINECDYGDFVAQAADYKTQAVKQLEMMLEQAKQLEAAQPKEPSKPQNIRVQRKEVFVPRKLATYTPIQAWPSDIDRAESPKLDHVCVKLEEAEQCIEMLSMATA